MLIKKLVVLCSLFVVAIASGQQSNFNVEKGNLVWTKTYESDVEVKEALKTIKRLKGVKRGVTSKVYNITNECGKDNVRNFMKESMNAKVLIKQNKGLGSYIVSVSEIKFTDNVTYGSFNTETASAPKEIEDYVLKEESGKVIENKITKNSLSCINETFTALFTFK